MRLELSDPRLEGGRLVATLTALDYGYSLAVSCWPELLEQWGAATVQAFLVKEGVPVAQAKLEQRRARGETDAALDRFAVELAAEIPGRLAAFYDLLEQEWTVAEDAERLAGVQAERALALPQVRAVATVAGAV
jgi:hypothetical protein